ncbi:hypothetical protein [Roseinatronobacter monicus]|uniref:Uncharacterized protein n=1 Tax=Roseinatronobacter monicus TaxID=393481 RepID=A0A543KIK2_9RHOB|nr:hypothetical protein [Roseinatronobacter monicus]TQM94905.1 hypothetical protein BD293_3596 [Roseinatronobacter monicus]
MGKKKASIYGMLQKHMGSCTEAKILIRGPKDVIEKFRKFKEERGFRNAWGALEYLLLKELSSSKKK